MTPWQLMPTSAAVGTAFLLLTLLVAAPCSDGAYHVLRPILQGGEGGALRMESRRVGEPGGPRGFARGRSAAPGGRVLSWGPEPPSSTDVAGSSKMSVGPGSGGPVRSMALRVLLCVMSRITGSRHALPLHQAHAAATFSNLQPLVETCSRYYQR